MEIRSRALLAGITVFLSLTAALVVAEVAARVAGYRPREAAPPGPPEPRVHRPDPVLGWRTVPGRGVFGPYVPGGDIEILTIRPDGARTTGPVVAGERPLVLLVGCSFTMGWAVSDDETWAWNLQARRPDLEVLNFGEAGYGTVQSLLLLEQLLNTGRRPAWVLYGAITGHEVRNVAAPSWLEVIGSVEPHETPYATLATDGHVELHPPIGRPSFQMDEHFALVALLERAWSRVRPIPTVDETRRITVELIEEMAATARAHGVRFSLVLLAPAGGSATSALAIGESARERNVDVIDCQQRLGPRDVVPGEGLHPNAGVHSLWVDCIAAAMAERLPRR